MKVLFSPSETKSTLVTDPQMSASAFIFPQLYHDRLAVIERYMQLLATKDHTLLAELFGIQDASKYETYLSSSLMEQKTCKAIERYTGVAYDYLDYTSLDQSAKDFIDENVLIFSNLFGPLLASNLIPEYKYKQGTSLNGYHPEAFFKTTFTPSIDEWLCDDVIVDLRASFYEKFYMPSIPYITMKFLKNGKVVSHFAKAYRGAVLREIALHQPQSENELQNIVFNNLKIVEIQHKKLKREYTYEIID